MARDRLTEQFGFDMRGADRPQKRVTRQRVPRSIK
jgi:hypothetical protein